MEYPYITIGCPVRDRSLYLPHYLNCIKNQDYPLEKVTLLFIENDSQDSTLSILNNFKNENSSIFHRIKILNYNQNTPSDKRNTIIREQYTYSALSKLRNYWLAQIKTDFAISCDSDIMMPPDTVKKLVSHNLDYVAGLIVNGYIIKPENPYLFTNILNKNKLTYKHISDYPENSLIEVDFSGAVMCLSKKACKLGIFNWHKQGEDAIFCESLKQQGIKLYCDTGCKCTHLMTDELLEKFKNEGFFF
jgi:glycosyltransferase involved in cell wall biosynthesis